MKRHHGLFTVLLPAAVSLAITVPAAAQLPTKNGEIARPDYGSGASSGFLSNTNFNTPESDGRPGVKFYMEGMEAYHHGHYEHAIYMLKLAAYWAYAPAAYNLGVMYFQGEGGVPVNRPLGTAWMFIAAQRGASDYVDARHMMVTKLDSAERTKAYDLLQQLEPKYGDKTAMRRAKSQWAYAKSQKTGTRVGGTVGNLQVGIQAAQGQFHTQSTGGSGSVGHVVTTAAQILTGGSVDGAVAYRQFQESSNPYSPVFLKNPKGTATVGPLQPVGEEGTKASPATHSKSGQPLQKGDDSSHENRG